ncbi:2-methylisocitrate lyase-like PEP mutase family enzyme [Tamaricihabitans halophyticus]|uniref:2-methylisocitrate lyase-like PEP mutase family enzyme n=1 Tax=Tamaricihabitans halophyticus TaxID=1262583 RepID=A0A4R2R0Z1_9PSEU|nr:isocitrate lyase/PEP mutase family protein [Tamaricihabitans halophyticus]TCP55249.1 2-methylisocitrate lyase-like PEP mutase family enzyme [Tamaricihabitans halophyticus]
MTTTGNPLRELVAPGLATPALGAPNALTARVIEDMGFPAVYLTGAGVANTFLGVPDIGLVTLTELAQHVRTIADTVSIPLIVDADTGFGNALGVQRTVRLLEQAGASAIQIEDQESPKRCGHFDGQTVIDQAEMVQKIRMAVDTRRADFLLIARTDAINTLGFDQAVERAIAYHEAGADVIFVEGPTDHEQLAAIPRHLPGVPLVANMVEGGRTPLVDRTTLASLGFGVALFANVALQASVHGMQQALAKLRDSGDLKQTQDLVLPWAERQRLVRKPEFDKLEQRYSAGR